LKNSFCFKDRDDLIIKLTKLRNGLQKKSLLKNQLWIEMDEYTEYGGYPAITPGKEKKEKLEDIRDSFVKRDILESNVKDEIKFYD
jgi:predicted AAA+ superfamily ATPase